MTAVVGEASTSAAPKLAGILETAVYVDDLARSRAFYEGVLGLSSMVADQRFCAYPVAPGQVFLVFLRGGTLEPVKLPGGVIPPHDGHGPLHMAFAIAAGELAAWERRLGETGVAIESRVHWPKGGTSLYFRDPDGNVIELATPGLWANY